LLILADDSVSEICSKVPKLIIVLSFCVPFYSRCLVKHWWNSESPDQNDALEDHGATKASSMIQSNVGKVAESAEESIKTTLTILIKLCFLASMPQFYLHDHIILTLF
jgi:hypothetical protein